MLTTTDKAKKVQDTRPETQCTFAVDGDDHDDIELSGITTGHTVGIDDDISLEIIETNASTDALKLWPWVNRVRAILIQRAVHNRCSTDFATMHRRHSRCPLNYHSRSLCSCSGAWGMIFALFL
jgi:hypothetical protein